MPLKITSQEITKIKCDAILNTAGEDAWFEAKKTPDAPYKQVIHIEKPDRDVSESYVEDYYNSSLALALKYDFESVAVPLISNGDFSRKSNKVLRSAMKSISDFLSNNDMTVYLSVDDKSLYEYDREEFSRIVWYLYRNGDNLLETTGSPKIKTALERRERELQERLERAEREAEERAREQKEKTDKEQPLWGSFPSQAANNCGQRHFVNARSLLGAKNAKERPWAAEYVPRILSQEDNGSSIRALPSCCLSL